MKNFEATMRFKIMGLFMIGILSLWGCSKAKFEKSSNPHCSSDTGICQFDETIFVSGGMVDILFVDDNSGSMSFEQSKMAERFPTLLQILDDRMLDYRIAITTTDIQTANNPARAINQNGNLQNGNLITFANGSKYLEPNTPDKLNLFLTAMKRPETLECEQYITSAINSGISTSSIDYQNNYNLHCPSGDERGISAALRAVVYNQTPFIRPEAHLAMVFISDENERSWGYTDPASPYVLEKQDLPQTLIDTIKQKYPSKSLAAHSVVVQSNDNSCLQIQNNQMGGLVKGQFGSIYETLSTATQGVIGNVCDSDYGLQMGRIGAAIVKQVESFGIHCENPSPFSITFNPTTSASTYHLTGRRVFFDKNLDPSVRVRFQYNCPIIE